MRSNDKLHQLSEVFRRFSEIEAVELSSPLYAELALLVSQSPRLLELASYTPRNQPAPNLLFAVAQYLLLSGVQHELREHYPRLSMTKYPPSSASDSFLDFCLANQQSIIELMASRLVQTNVVRRCSCLLPAFSKVFHEANNSPLSIVDLGASAGLNLNFDRYSYQYLQNGEVVLEWGNLKSPVQINTYLREDRVPDLLPEIPIGSRIGIELRVVDIRDVDAALWLQSLVWPEHIENHECLLGAFQEFKSNPAKLLQGDAGELLPTVIGELPKEEALVVYTTISTYQFPIQTIESIELTLAEQSKSRPVWYVALETGGTGTTELTLKRYKMGEVRAAERLATASPHGWWLNWEAD